MIGHGSPRINCAGIAIPWVALMLAIISVNHSAMCRATDVTLPADAISSDSASSDPAKGEPSAELTRLLDLSTAPFEFRSTNPDWPLVAASDRNTLTVTVKSLTQHAGQEMLLIYELVRVDDGRVVGREQTELRLSSSGDSETISLAASAPESAGVYEIRCRLTEKPDRIWSRFTHSPRELASTKTPWMVYATAVERLPDSPSTRSPIAPLAWKEKRSLPKINPSDWQSPSWMPNGATRLVPNVKRVSESLSPWRDDSSPRSHEILPGDSFVGLMKDLQRHHTYQLTMAIGPTVVDPAPAVIRIDFSPSPTFESISKTLKLYGESQLDVSAEGLLTVRNFSLLHHPNADAEFIRITNESTDRPVSLESLQFAQHDLDAVSEQQDAAHRGVTLWIESANWLDNLTSDYFELAGRHDYADSTVLMYRLWKASTRLGDHSRWCGYDEINLTMDLGDVIPVPALVNDSNQGGLPQSEVQPKDAGNSETAGVRWAVANSATAMTHWTAGEGVKIVHRLPGKSLPTEKAIVGFGSRDDSVAISGESCLNPALQIVDGLLAHDERLTIYAADLPLSFEAAFRESIAQFIRSPVAVKRLDSTMGTDADYIDVLISPEPKSGVERAATLLTVVNSAPWSSQVALQFSSTVPGQCRLLDSGVHHSGMAGDSDAKAVRSKAVLSDGASPGGRLLKLPPTSIVTLEIQSNGGPVRLASWQASMVDAEQTLARLKGGLSEVVAKIGTLTLPQDFDELRNGGFEVAGQVGIVGWMHTQFPDSAVALDPNEAIEGSRSIRMTTDAKSAERTWLVSEPIPVPASGRLAVSLATRAGARPSESKSANASLVAGNSAPLPLKSTAIAAIENGGEKGTHRVKVSLEGIRLGKPLRLAREFEVAANGSWQTRRIVLETDQIRPSEIDSLRLTIDSLSVGKLWIDDIHLHDRFPTQTERVALQGKTFLAIQGLQKGNLKPAAILLNNRWSQYLLAQSDQRRLFTESVPLQNSKPPSRVMVPSGEGNNPADGKGAPTEKTAPSPSVAPTPKEMRGHESVADRLREWLPKPIRF